VIPLWLLAEVAIVACDLAELVGTALALQLLFGLPLPVGVLVTAFDTLVLLGLQRFGIRRLEALVISLVALVGACFAVEMLLLRPDVASVLGGLVPRMDPLRNSSSSIWPLGSWAPP
jgi:manganese transport protein